MEILKTSKRFEEGSKKINGLTPKEIEIIERSGLNL